MTDALTALIADLDSGAELSPVAKTDNMLPVERLSPSSIEGFWKCPEQWRRERVMREPSFATAEKVFGSAFHKAAEHNFRAKIDTHEDLPVQEMRDVAGDSFTSVVAETLEEQEIRWYDDKPHVIQAGVITAVVGTDRAPGYHQVLAPTIQPVAVERWTEVETPVGVPLVGKIDVETDTGQLVDLKTGKKAKVQIDLDKSIQATSYLWAREQEGQPAAGFAWHTAIRTVKPQQQELLTSRTARELRMFERLLEVTANTILDYQARYGDDGPWPGTSPLSWFCTPKQCSFWGQCEWRGGSK